MQLKRILYQPGPVARVILNRPEKLNAQSLGLLAEMDWAFNAAVEDPECRVIVLSGMGRSFSAGHDLSTDDQRAETRERIAGKDPFAQGLMYRDIYTDSHLRWRDLPKPTIAMVHGQCIYGGWMIAAAMDIVFAAEDALFIPTYGDYFTTAWDVGPRKAKELLFANRFITASEAMAWGFVNRTCDRGAGAGDTGIRRKGGRTGRGFEPVGQVRRQSGAGRHGVQPVGPRGGGKLHHAQLSAAGRTCDRAARWQRPARPVPQQGRPGHGLPAHRQSQGVRAGAGRLGSAKVEEIDVE
jgi:enoyl-CoA hydratase/carnithine racemase